MVILHTNNMYSVPSGMCVQYTPVYRCTMYVNARETTIWNEIQIEISSSCINFIITWHIRFVLVYYIFISLSFGLLCQTRVCVCEQSNLHTGIC